MGKIAEGSAESQPEKKLVSDHEKVNPEKWHGTLEARPVVDKTPKMPDLQEGLAIQHSFAHSLSSKFANLPEAFRESFAQYEHHQDPTMKVVFDSMKTGKLDEDRLRSLTSSKDNRHV